MLKLQALETQSLAYFTKFTLGLFGIAVIFLPFEFRSSDLRGYVPNVYSVTGHGKNGERKCWPCNLETSDRCSGILESGKVDMLL